MTQTIPSAQSLNHLVECFLVEYPNALKYLALDIEKSHPLPYCLSCEDLIQDGTIGVLYAARNYNPYKMIDFATYAKQKARYAMLSAVRYARLNKRDRVKEPHFLADTDLFFRIHPGPDNTAQDFEQADWVQKAFDRLPPRLQEVLLWIYDKEQPLRDLAQQWEVSASRLSQLHTEAKQRLFIDLGLDKSQKSASVWWNG